MYHAEVKLIKTVKPVAVEGRAPWPKLEIRGSFELQHAEEVRVKTHSKEELRGRSRKVEHAELKAKGICAICKEAKSRPSKSSCAPCYEHRKATHKLWYAAKKAGAKRCALSA